MADLIQSLPEMGGSRGFAPRSHQPETDIKCVQHKTATADLYVRIVPGRVTGRRLLAQ